jgi:NADP-dependent 3-hydroxy acid dehydrogenase YdfG
LLAQRLLFSFAGSSAMKLKGQVVVITGASAGVGRATARAFAKQGAKIALIARGIDGLQAAKKEIEALGGQALAIPLDVSDHLAMDSAVARIEQTLGAIDIWVNNAMLSVFSPAKEMRPEEYKRVTDVTYLGYVYATLAVLKYMLPRNRGVIIQIGSALAYRSIPLQSAYCAAKHAVLGFTESLRTELLHDHSKVQVMMMELPAVNTTQFSWVKSRLPKKPQPVPPIFQPEVIADAIVFAAQRPRKEYWIGFPTVKAIIAEKFVSNFADHWLAKAGYSSQQTQEPVSPDRLDNLWNPVPGDHGAHGTFDNRSRNFSVQFWLSKNRSSLAVAGFAIIILAGYLITK